MWKHVNHAKKQCTTLHSILITLHSVFSRMRRPQTKSRPQMFIAKRRGIQQYTNDKICFWSCVDVQAMLIWRALKRSKRWKENDKTKTRRRTKYVVWEKITVKCHQIHFPFIRSFTGTCNNKFWPTSDRKRECPALLKLNKQIWTHCKCIAQYHNLSIMSRVCSELLDWARKRENGYFGNEFQKDLKTFLNSFSPFLHYLSRKTDIEFDLQWII